MSDAKDKLSQIRAEVGAPGLSDEQLERVLTRVLEKKGVIGRPAPAPGIGGVVCPVCGHRGVETTDGKCPNNNCVRNTDPAVKGLHPEHGHPIHDADELKEAQAAFAESQA